MGDDIKKILESATLAPSGENCQPWRFVVEKNKIAVFNAPEADQSLYSWGQRASYMAIGAAIENIAIAASQFGYFAQISLFPDENDADLVANIELKAGNDKQDALYEFIPLRCTNRKPYEDKPLGPDKIRELQNSVEGDKVEVIFTEDASDKKILGEVGSTNEEVMFNNQYLHQFFFAHVNWTKEEDAEKKVGFFIDTLELPPPAKAGLRLFKYWPITKFFNTFGLNKMISKQNAAVNSQSSGFGILTIADKTPESFVRAGRALQRLWLTATKLGLSFQPLTGVLFFMCRIMAGDTEKFGAGQVDAIQKAYSNITRIFGVKDDRIVAFMFRIGFGGEPSARASRFGVEQVAKVK